jgi:hypothetical protein
MKISLVDVDSKIPNLALMKLSAYHKARGDSVKPYDPLFDRPDLIYASKTFDFSRDYDYFPNDIPVIKGGIAYEPKSKLSDEIDSMCPDYFLYNCEYAMGFTTRGCIRRCPFCKVWQSEGHIRAVGDIYDFWTGQTHLKLLDNNLTAMPDRFEVICKQLIEEKVKVDFSQGLDIRLITDDMAELLSKVKRWKRIHFAFDGLDLEQAVRSGIERLTKYIHPDQLTFYVLIGYNTTPEEDLYRVELLRSLRVNPFVMPYNKRDRYQMRFARWVNNKAVWKTTSWENYGKKIATPA